MAQKWAAGAVQKQAALLQAGLHVQLAGHVQGCSCVWELGVPLRDPKPILELNGW